MNKSTLLRASTAAFLGAWSAYAFALDPLSYAKYDQVKTTALHLDLKADFAKKSLDGYAELTLNWIDKKATTLDLDTRELTISKIEAQDGKGAWRKADYTLGKFDEEKGQPLQVKLPAQQTKVRIHYRTAPTATALQWLQPVQTMSGKYPFMFSQSQAINARSWVPIQDTPAVRFTYTARIEAPEGLRVVMSADNDMKGTGKGGWKFTMPQPIPSYLLAIGIGELEARTLGGRTGVYAEPQRIKAAEYELADTEKMVEAAEKLYGPYRWGRYDMLVLPPSFPIGGMENPRLTFLTPTMIAGDRSLVDLVAHELAHSWSGNLVTNATWKHWWLNEGFTTYVTTRILEEIYGKEVALMNLQLEQEEALEMLGELSPAKQALVSRQPDTNAADYPDTSLAYPKGAWFLHTLEARAGRAAFDVFLRSWFDQHAFQSVTNEQFIAFLRTQLLAKNPKIMTDAELDEWIHGPGIPASAQRVVSQRLAKLNASIDGWTKGTVSTAQLDAKDWNAVEWMKFLNDIDNKAGAGKLAELDRAYGLAKSTNNEVAFRFYRAAVHAGYRDVRPQLEAFLMSVGRQKFVVPLYAALRQQPEDRAWAEGIHKKARERYHPETQSSVDKAMGKQ
jgi:leukotriene-A4 hydrolase